MFTVIARRYGNCDRYVFRAIDAIRVDRMYRDILVRHVDGRITRFHNVRYADYTGNRPSRECFAIVLERCGTVEF